MSAANVSSASVLQLNSRIPLVSASNNRGHPVKVQNSQQQVVGVNSFNKPSKKIFTKVDAPQLSYTNQHYQHQQQQQQQQTSKRTSKQSVNHIQESSALKDNISQHPQYQEEFNKIRERLFRVLSKVPIQVSSDERNQSTREATVSSPVKQTSQNGNRQKSITREPLIIKYYNERSLSEILELHFSCSLIKHNYQLTLAASTVPTASSPVTESEVNRVQEPTTTVYDSSLATYSSNSTSSSISNNQTHHNCPQAHPTNQTELPFLYHEPQVDNHQLLYPETTHHYHQHHQHQHHHQHHQQQQQQPMNSAYSDHQHWQTSSSSTSWPHSHQNHHHLIVTTYDCPSIESNNEEVKNTNCGSNASVGVATHRRSTSHHKAAASSKHFSTWTNSTKGTSSKRQQQRLSRLRISTSPSPSNKLSPVAALSSQQTTEIQLYQQTTDSEDRKPSIKYAQTNGNSSELQQHFIQQELPTTFNAHYTYPASAYQAAGSSSSSSCSADAGLNQIGEACILNEAPPHLLLTTSFPPSDQISSSEHNSGFSIQHPSEVQQQLYELEQQPSTGYYQQPASYQRIELPSNWHHQALMGDEQTASSVQLQQMIDQPAFDGSYHCNQHSFYSGQDPHYATFICSQQQQQQQQLVNCPPLTSSEQVGQVTAETQHAMNKWNQSAN